MRPSGLLLVSFGFVVAAACSGGDRSAGGITGNDAGGSSSDAGGDAGADPDRPCGYPGEDCCRAPAVPCGIGTVCASGSGKCMISELVAVGEYFDRQQTSRPSAIAVYDGNAWTAGPDLVVDSDWWSPTDLVSSAPGNYLVTLVRHGVEGSRDQGRLFNFHAGLWHKCEPGEACVGPEVPSRPFWCVASIADEVWIGADNALYRCPPGGSCISGLENAPSSGWAQGKLVGTGPQDIWYATLTNTLHFDGTKWAIHDAMKAVTIFEVREDDVWLPQGTTLRHWDGKSWSTAYAIDGAPATGTIWSISGSSSTDIWAVGSDRFAAHWDGTSWRYQPLPTATGAFRVYAPSPIEAYVATGTGVYRWDGAQWTKVAMPADDAGGDRSWSFITGPAKPRP